MSGFGKRIDGPRGRRRSVRQEVCLIGSALSLQGSKSVLVEDLCVAGAKLLGRGLPPPGKEIMIRAGDLSLFGRVAWARQDRRGVEFEAAIEEAAA